MVVHLRKRKATRKRRVFSIRKKMKDRPRLSVYKSNKNIFAQIIDDEKGVTLASFGSYKLTEKNKKEAAKIIGDNIAKLAKEKNIVKVVFDRGRFKYHGIIKELAESARAAGLEF